MANTSKSAKRPSGRPKKVEGESLVVQAGAMLQSAIGAQQGGVYFLPIDEIILRKGWKTYRDMRHDDQVKACLAFKKTLVVGRAWEMRPAHDGYVKGVEKAAENARKAAEKKAADEAQAKALADAAKNAPAPGDKTNMAALPPVKPGSAVPKSPSGDTPPKSASGDVPPDPSTVPPDLPPGTTEEDITKAQDIARFVEFALKRFNANKKLNEALSAFDYGFSLGEIVFETGMWEGQRMVLIKDIKFKDPQAITIRQDDFGNVLGFRQQAMLKIIDVEPEKCWHFVHQGEFGNAYGVSDLRSAYRSWWAKKFIINFWNVFLERMGQPMTMMKYPAGASDKMKDDLKRILRGLATKTEILVPTGVEVALVEATRAGTATYGEALNFHNSSIARSMLMAAILGLEDTKGGRPADSQSRLQLRIMFKMADTIAHDLSNSFMEQVVKPLIDMNFDHNDLYPEFIWQHYGQFEGMEIADTIRTMHAAGMIELDQTDINYCRSIVGLPLRDEDDNPDTVVRPMDSLPPIGGGGGAPSAGGNKPPPAAPSGNENAKKGPGGNRKTEPGTTQTRK